MLNVELGAMCLEWHPHGSDNVLTADAIVLVTRMAALTGRTIEWARDDAAAAWTPFGSGGRRSEGEGWSCVSPRTTDATAGRPSGGAAASTSLSTSLTSSPAPARREPEQIVNPEYCEARRPLLINRKYAS